MVSGAPPPPPPGPDNEVVDEALDLEEAGRDEIIDFITARFKGHGMARLVDGILKALGLYTRVSEPGPDGGVDIVAAGGPMGFDAHHAWSSRSSRVTTLRGRLCSWLSREPCPTTGQRTGFL